LPWCVVLFQFRRRCKAEQWFLRKLPSIAAAFFSFYFVIPFSVIKIIFDRFSYDNIVIKIVVIEKFYDKIYYDKNILLLLWSMNDYQQFRTTMQLGQADLARWLQVSQSLINYAENGKRKLPSKAEARFLSLQQVLEALPAQPVPWAGVEGSLLTQPEKIEALQHKSQVCQRDMLAIRKRIAVLARDIEKQERAMHFAKMALESEWVMQDPALQTALEIWFERLRLKYAEEGRRALKHLEFQLEQTEREFQFLQNAVLDYAPGPY